MSVTTHVYNFEPVFNYGYLSPGFYINPSGFSQHNIRRGTLLYSQYHFTKFDMYTLYIGAFMETPNDYDDYHVGPCE